MDVGSALRYIRKKKGYTQREMVTEYIDRTAYSRIENNTRSIRINDLQDILNHLSVHSSEFFCLAPLDQGHTMQEFRELYHYCGNHLEDEKAKNKLLGCYEKARSSEERSLKDISNYVSVKAYFHQFWPEVEPLSKQELEELYEMLIEKDYYFHYDYILINSLLTILSSDQLDSLIAKAIPIKNKENRDYTTKKIAFNVLANAVNAKVYSGEYEAAKSYLLLSEEQMEDSYDYGIKLNYHYLNNLVEYIITGDPEYYNKITRYISLLKDLGEASLAAQVSKEVQLLTHGNPKERLESQEAIVTLMPDL